MSTIEQLLEVENEINETSNIIKNSFDVSEREDFLTYYVMLLRNKVALLNNFWLEMFEIGVELSKDDKNSTVKELLKPINT